MFFFNACRSLQLRGTFYISPVADLTNIIFLLYNYKIFNTNYFNATMKYIYL